MSTHDTWILVPVPSPRTAHGRAVPSPESAAVRIGLALLSWAEHRRDRTRRSIALDRVERPAIAPRPFC